MENCIFCKIVKEEIPAYKVYEDEAFLAFLDIHPQGIGHVQIIPKEHFRWVWDLPAMPENSDGRRVSPNIGDYFEVTRKIALAQQKAFNTEMILCRITGEEVPHAHIWVFPSKDVPGDKMDFVQNAEKLRLFL